jgi:hypothetical protein
MSLYTVSHGLLNALVQTANNRGLPKETAALMVGSSRLLPSRLQRSVSHACVHAALSHLRLLDTNLWMVRGDLGLSHFAFALFFVFRFLVSTNPSSTSFLFCAPHIHRLCGLVLTVHGYRPKGPGLDFLRCSGPGTGSTQSHEGN